MGGNFLGTGFPAARWDATNSAADLAAAIVSIDTAIRYVLFGAVAGVNCDFASKTKPVKFSDGLVEVLNDFQIGSGETVDDIVDTIPLIPGINEDHELATVEALRAFIVAYAAVWGDDIYIPIITTPTAGNFPVMTADGELETSSYDHETWITRITGPISGNFPMMQPDGLLASTAWGADDFVTVTGDTMTGDLVLTGGAAVKLATIAAYAYHWLDQFGLNVTDDTGATRSAIHLGIDNADIGTPYFRSAAGNHYELYHEGNFKGLTGFQSGAMKCTATTPSAAGTVPVTQSLDAETWVQGDGDTLFNVTGGNVVVSEPGIYAIQVMITSPGAIVVGVLVADGVKTFVSNTQPISGDLTTFAAPVFIMDLADDAAVTLQVFHPGGSATPLAASLIITKIGVTGAAA